MNRPGIVEAIWLKSGLDHGGLTGELPRVVCLRLRGWGLADGFEQAMVVTPSHSFARCELDGPLGLPWPATMDQLRLLAAIDGLRQGIVIADTLAADQGFAPNSLRVARRSEWRRTG